MPVPTTRDDLNVTESLNSPAGSEAIGTSLDNYIRAHAAIVKQYVTDVADGTSASKGAALVGYKASGSGTVARTVQARLDDTKTSADAGPAVDGVSDDSAALQAYLDANAGKLVWILPGTYGIGAELIVKRNTTINMHGATFKALASLPVNKSILRNENADRTDTNIRIYGGTFDGNRANRTAVTAGLVTMNKTVSALFRDCEFKESEYLCLVLAGDKNTKVINCDFHDGGRTTSISSAIWAQGYVADVPDTATENLIVDGCHFWDWDRSGITASMKGGGRISNCTFTDCSESTIFISGNTADTSDSPDAIQIIGNRITRSVLTDVAAAGIEIEVASNVIIQGNVIEETDGSAITLNNVTDTIISGNTFKNCCQAGTLPSGIPAEAIHITTSTTAPGSAPSNILIDGNIFIENQGSPTQAYCIGTGTQGAGTTAVARLTISNNHMKGGFGTAAFNFVGGGPDTSVRIVNNRGHASEAPVSLQVQVPASTGNQTYSVGFRPHMIVIEAVLLSTTKVQTSKQWITYLDGGTNSHDRKGYSTSHSNASASNATLNTPANWVEMKDETGTVVTVGTSITADKDSFTINWTNVTARPWLNIIAYP